MVGHQCYLLLCTLGLMMQVRNSRGSDMSYGNSKFLKNQAKTVQIECLQPENGFGWAGSESER